MTNATRAGVVALAVAATVLLGAFAVLVLYSTYGFWPAFAVLLFVIAFDIPVVPLLVLGRFYRPPVPARRGVLGIGLRPR